MRLDHLLSREYQVEVIGEISALLAPRLIATIGSASPARWARRRPEVESSTPDRWDRWRPGENTDTARFESDFLSLFKG